MIVRITALFPLWAVLGALLAWFVPDPFAACRPAILPLLGVVMFGMGAGLRVENFLAVLRRPTPVILGLGLQFLMMPLAGWLLALLAGLPPQLAAGVILVGCSPGGTASNVICYLARGDVALSITLTACSTLLAVLATPLLMLLYAGETVDVPALDMLQTIFWIIFLPVTLGTLLNHLLHRSLTVIRQVFPMLSVFTIVFIIAVIVALNREQLAGIATGLFVLVALHNLAGLAGGYWGARWLGQDRRISRTLAIEVGMQNSGLAVALAIKYFSAAAALPGALFSVWHNLSGSMLAGHWRRRVMADE
ncbi:MAG: bile acid:sodium symporter family protein [Gammaproteobacteria bacterium]|jgi:BASS family bile acid:Na+ symporter